VKKEKRKIQIWVSRWTTRSCNFTYEKGHPVTSQKSLVPIYSRSSIFNNVSAIHRLADTEYIDYCQGWPK